MNRNSLITPIQRKNFIEACDHPITIKDFCGVCGRDLRKDGMPGQKAEETSAIVPMVHHIPELLVSSKLSKEYGKKDRDMLLKNRKLALLVDLDQTLVHTSNRKPNNSELSPDIMEFDMYNVRYFTKIRPHATSFLRKISECYELHVVTFGARLYAHKITRILDPDGKYFHHRILSRDELLSSVHKTRNIKSLFPLGDELLVIIDDRPDVWEYSDALIRVKPYVYFGGVGDINSPLSNNWESSKIRPKQSMVFDKDSSLLDVQKILLEIHALYYKRYDEEKKVNDVKRLMVKLRNRVFENDEIALTGIIPRSQNPQMHWIYKTCVLFGAKVSEKVTETTTIIIAEKLGTKKLKEANRLGIPVVSIEWLLACFYKWQRVNEKIFELKNEEQQEERTSLANHVFVSKIPRMDKETLNEMNDEVNEALLESEEENSNPFTDCSSSDDDDEMVAAIEKQMDSS